MSFIAIRGSIYFKYNEEFIDNAFVVNTNKQPNISQITTQNENENENELSEEEKARRARMNKWKDCNIFTCKNPDSEADYEAWLKSLKDKQDKYLDKNKKVKTVKKQQKCPPRISLSEWNEDILTEEEKDAQERLEEIQDQEDELNQKIRELEQRLADQQREFTMNTATQQQALNDLEHAKNTQKNMKLFETSLDIRVRDAIDKVEKKVNSYEKPIKSIKDLLKKIDDLKKKVESISAVSGAPPPKKKKKGLLGKIKKAFK